MLNIVILQGNLTSIPQLKKGSNEVSYLQFQIAVNQYYNKKQSTDFISCTAFGSNAEFIAKYFTRGSQIIVKGSLHQNNYTDSNGVTHYNMQVTVTGVDFCGKKITDSDAKTEKQSVSNLYEDNDVMEFSLNENDLEAF